MISMTKCALSNCEPSQGPDLLKTNHLKAEEDVFAQAGDSDRKPLCFWITKEKKNLFGRQRCCFSFECLKKITELARFCCKNISVTIANKPVVKAKNFCRTVLREPV